MLNGWRWYIVSNGHFTGNADYKTKNGMVDVTFDCVEMTEIMP